MTDRQLLELAAKAAGIDLTFENGKPQKIEMFRGHLPNYDDWNPLTDDGDALRLAVRLEIDVSYRAESARAFPTVQTQDFIREDFGTDPSAATRRAIVRAAAAIGEKMGGAA